MSKQIVNNIKIPHATQQLLQSVIFISMRAISYFNTYYLSCLIVVIKQIEGQQLLLLKD